LETTTHCATETYGNGLSEKVRYQGQSGELIQLLGISEARQLTEKPRIQPLGFFRCFPRAFAIPARHDQKTESACADPKNRISKPGSLKIVCNSQILCLTEKSYLTVQVELTKRCHDSCCVVSVQSPGLDFSDLAGDRGVIPNQLSDARAVAREARMTANRAVRFSKCAKSEALVQIENKPNETG